MGSLADVFGRSGRLLHAEGCQWVGQRDSKRVNSPLPVLAQPACRRTSGPHKCTRSHKLAGALDDRRDAVFLLYAFHPPLTAWEHAGRLH